MQPKKTLGLAARIVALSVLSAAGFAGAVGAHAADDPLDALAACRAEPDDASKVACFEAATQALLDARDRGDLYVVESETVDEIDRNTFGLALPSLPSLGIGEMFRRHADEENGDREDAMRASADGVAPSESLVEAEGGAVVATERADDGRILEVSMTVDHTERNLEGKLVFYMQNNQVWRQIDDERIYVPSDVAGRSASIKRGSLGSFRLRLEGVRRAIRVRREE